MYVCAFSALDARLRLIPRLSAATLPELLRRLDAAGARYISLEQAQADPAYAQPGGGSLISRAARERGIALAAPASPSPAPRLEPRQLCR